MEGQWMKMRGTPFNCCLLLLLHRNINDHRETHFSATSILRWTQLYWGGGECSQHDKDCGFKLLHDHGTAGSDCAAAYNHLYTPSGSIALGICTHWRCRMKIQCMQSVHWETEGSAMPLFTIQGHPQPSRPGILWGGREGGVETLAKQIKVQAFCLKNALITESLTTGNQTFQIAERAISMVKCQFTHMMIFSEILNYIKTFVTIKKYFININ